MTLDPRAPVIIGVGQFLWRAEGVEDAREPIELMADAVRAAADDAGLAAVPAAVDSIRVVNSLSWRYGNPGAVLAQRLGVTAAESAYTAMGGNVPQSLVNQTALDIQAGRLDLAVVVGGEAWRTRMRARKAGITLEWDAAGRDVDSPTTIGEDFEMTLPAEAAIGVVMPVQVYPMFETAIRAAAHRDPADHVEHIAQLWSRFSAVAATNPHAWNQVELAPDDIATATPQNRIVGWPYTKSMNSNNDVDMAAAIIMCSAERAAAMGVARDRWVFPHAGTDCHEHPFVSNRDSFAETPAIRIGGRRALELAGVGIDDVDIIDLYSCFPSAVQLGAASLGVDVTRQLTRTGGLSFAGGPWNSYVMHAIAAVVADVRGSDGGTGLVWANGGFATKHSFGVYGPQPPAQAFRHDCPQSAIDALPRRVLATADDATGPVTIEAYTVMHGRDSSPELAITTCLLPDGRRAWGLSRDDATMSAMTDGEWVGRPVGLDGTGALHV